MTGKARQPASIEMMSSVMPSAKNSCSGSPLKLANGKHRDRAPIVEARRARRERRARGAELFRLLGCLAAHPVDLDRSADVLEALRAEILEIEIDLVDDLVVDDPGNINAAGLGERLDPRRDVDAVAEDVAALGDDVAEIDPDAHRDALLVRQRLVPLRGTASRIAGGAARRLDHAVELDQHQFAGPLEDVAAEFGGSAAR